MVHIGKKLLNNMFSGDKRSVESKKKAVSCLLETAFFLKVGIARQFYLMIVSSVI